jgi:curved DNA-binding protein CbpA
MTQPFVDHYEVLQLSPRATSETIERVYRLLAKRYHPDNQDTGNLERFAEVRKAFEVLSDPDRRAAYDVRHDEMQGIQWKVFNQESAEEGRGDDRRIIHAILSILYVERRRDPMRGGLGMVFIERTLGVPDEHLKFPLWYMKQHGWIETLDTGQVAITIEGIDRLADRDLALREDRLLGESSANGSGRSENGSRPRAIDRLSAVV